MKDWGNGLVPSQVIALATDPATPNLAVTFESKESTATSHEPRLDVELIGGPVGPQGPTGPQGLTGPQGSKGDTGAQGP